jgi:hypothetical protein
VRILDPAAYGLMPDSHCPCLVATALTLPSLGPGAFAEIEF